MSNNTPFFVRVCYMNPLAESMYNGGPSYATCNAAGMDLRACIDMDKHIIKPGHRVAVPTGIAIQPLADNVAGFVYSRSGLGAKRGLTVAQGVGVIDNDYRGEIIVVLLNTSLEEQVIVPSERIAQLVFQPVLHAQIQICQNLDSTDRGGGGFGHTGKD